MSLNKRLIKSDDVIKSEFVTNDYVLEILIYYFFNYDGILHHGVLGFWGFGVLF